MVGFEFFLFVFGMFYCCRISRFWVMGLFLISIGAGMVSRSKISVFGGSQIRVVSLFVLILLVNFSGLLPYVFRVSSHLVFRVGFGFTFWLSLVMSSTVLGELMMSMAGLVFSGVILMGGMMLCWVEILSIFLRWVTLRVRLVANVTIGQIVTACLGDLVVVCWFGIRVWYVVVGFLLIIRCVLVVELGVRTIQAYLFCLLLTVYSGEHSV